MNLTNKNNLTKAALEYKVTPPEIAWLKLDKKIKETGSHKKLAIYKLSTVAAIFIAFVSVFALLKTRDPGENNAVISPLYSENMQNLNTINNDGIYEIEKLRDLKNAYRKINDKKGI